VVTEQKSRWDCNGKLKRYANTNLCKKVKKGEKLSTQKDHLLGIK
jgi:hypothetical protein